LAAIASAVHFTYRFTIPFPIVTPDFHPKTMEYLIAEMG